MSAYDVIEIRNPEEIPAAVEQHRPVALLVTQQGRDRAGGTEAWMAGLPADLPAIAVSLPNILGRARALGIANVLIKPVTREHLLQAVTGLGRVIHDVLIVDDEPQLADLYGRMLQSAGAGYRPVKSYGGGEALGRMRQQAVDLVLLDLLMSEMSGLEVLEAMKADPALAGTPVIVVSAQYPEPVCSEGGLLIQLVRAQDASLAETLSSLSALVATLPPRGLPPA
jgi:CheY-like chemotaxis protein